METAAWIILVLITLAGAFTTSRGLPAEPEEYDEHTDL